MNRPKTLLGICLIGAMGLATFAIGGNALGILTATLNSAWPLVPLAMGSALVIASGEIDLSVAGAVSMYGMLALFLANAGWPPALVVFASLLVGLAIASLNAVAVVRLGIPSLIATLATGLVCAGIALLLDSILTSSALDSLASDGNARVTRTLPAAYQLGAFRITYGWAIVVGLGLVAWRFFTLAGIRHLAVGLDREAATAAVLPVSRIRASALIASGLLAWLSSTLLQIGFQGGGWNPGAGRGLELTGIVVAVLGGTRITGGVFDPLAVMLAAILWQALGQLQYVLPGLGPETQLLFTGIIVAVVALMQARQRQAFL